MKAHMILSLAWLVLSLSACQTAKVCPPDSVIYLPDPKLFPTLASPPEPGQTPTPSLVEIGGKTLAVDRVIAGPLCNDTWRGTVYVGCNIQIVEWAGEEHPTFFEKCNLTIEPGTVVYVAAHNNAPYYNGCSCHTGGEVK